MNPRVALVILILLAIVAVFVLGLSIEGGGLGQSRGAGSPEDSDWSKDIADLLLTEKVFGPKELVDLKGKSYEPTLSPPGCLFEEGGATYVSRKKRTCILDFPPPPDDDGPFPKRETKRVLAVSPGACEVDANGVSIQWEPRVGKPVDNSSKDWLDGWLPMTREGGKLTISVEGTGNSKSSRCALLPVKVFGPEELARPGSGTDVPTMSPDECLIREGGEVSVAGPACTVVFPPIPDDPRGSPGPEKRRRVLAVNKGECEDAAGSLSISWTPAGGSEITDKNKKWKKGWFPIAREGGTLGIALPGGNGTRPRRCALRDAP